MAKTKQQYNREYYLKHRERILDKRYSENRRRNEVRFGDYRVAHGRYANSPKGRAAALGRLFRFLERHPEISENYLEMIEGYIRINERCLSLDTARGENETRLYDLISA